MAYEIRFAKSVRHQLKALRAHQRGSVLRAIELRLTHEPLTEARNRKPLRPNPIAPWELRVDDLRVFYDVPVGETSVVEILAIGQKRGNRLFIAGEEIQL